MGFNTSDDAGVYRLTDDMALVCTADFITPPVNDPFVYGQIAAANSLSDIFAIGARPLTAMNIVGFPLCHLGPEVLVQILQGGAERVQKAGAVIVGEESCIGERGTQNLVDDEPADMGLYKTGAPGVAIHDQFADVVKA